MLNHAGNSYITRRKQLCHPPDTVMLHRIHLLHHLVYLFCILIRLDSRSNDAVAKQSKQSSGILKRNTNLRAVISILFYFFFNLKISQVFSGDYTRISAPGWQESPGTLCHPLSSASDDIKRQGFCVTSELILWFVILEAIWYMYNVREMFCDNY